jgi:hypothetical protein
MQLPVAGGEKKIVLVSEGWGRGAVAGSCGKFSEVYITVWGGWKA